MRIPLIEVDADDGAGRLRSLIRGLIIKQVDFILLFRNVPTEIVAPRARGVAAAWKTVRLAIPERQKFLAETLNFPRAQSV